MARFIIVISTLLLICHHTQGVRVGEDSVRGSVESLTPPAQTAPQTVSCASEGDDNVLQAQDPNTMSIFGQQYIIPAGGSPAMFLLKAPGNDKAGQVLQWHGQQTFTNTLGITKSSEFHIKREVIDAAGNRVYNMKEHVFQFNNNKQTIYAAKANGSSGEQLYQVYCKVPLVNTVVLTSGMKNQKGEPIVFRMDSNWYNKQGVIRFGGEKTSPIIARICVPPQLKQYAGSDDAFVEVAQGVDMAAIMSMLFSRVRMSIWWTESHLD